MYYRASPTSNILAAFVRGARGPTATARGTHTSPEDLISAARDARSLLQVDNKSDISLYIFTFQVGHFYALLDNSTLRVIWHTALA